MRESPSVEIMDQQRKRGAEVAYSDPRIPVFSKMRRYRFGLESVALSDETIKHFDCTLLATNHDGFDYLMIAEQAKTLVDSRGVYRKGKSNIFPA